MTNRQWLMWKLIDMSDEEFRSTIYYKYCIHKDAKGNCPKDCIAGCVDSMLAWLRQEHKEEEK